MKELKNYRRFFSPETDDFNDKAVVEAAYVRALALPTESVEEFEKFVEAWMDVSECVREEESRHYIAMTCNTADKDAEAKYLNIVENVMPIVETRDFEMKKKFAASPAAASMPAKYEVFARNVKSEMELFRDENVPLKTEAAKLAQRYQKTVGGWMADWEEQKVTVMKVRAKLEENDRATRERAYLASVAPHRADTAKLDELYDEMLDVRGRIARNAGFADFCGYTFRNMGRFDYTPADCQSYCDAIRACVVPVVAEIMKIRKEKLGLDSIKPWDLIADENGLPPVKPFETGAQLEEKVHAALAKVDAEIGEYFGIMRAQRLLDLESREGKAPGGYMADLPARRLPFIFMNAVGRTRDVQTLLHEAGHATNLFLARDLSPSAYLNPPLEFAEVASMSMELISLPFAGLLYDAKDVARVKKAQLSEILTFLPFMAMIDSFQRWVYLNPSDAKSRADYWESLENAFRPHIDWTGVEDVKRFGWQYLHVFKVPFYYIEYGIAQLGALQVWTNSLTDHRKAVELYKNGLSLGGSRPLPELFSAAGAKFDMTEKTLAPLTAALAKEIGL